MTKDNEARAREIVEEYVLFTEDKSYSVVGNLAREALEKEFIQALEAAEKRGMERVFGVWPSEEEMKKKSREHGGCDYEDGFFDCYFWLRDKVKYLPKEQVSDEELRRLALKMTRGYVGEANPVPYGAVVGFELGYRAAEKKARGE